jgi:hypothetical protein
MTPGTSPLFGEQAALEALVCMWGEAYIIGCDEGQWWFRRRDGKGGIETAFTPDCLLAQIVTDFTVYPVLCQLPPGGTGQPLPPGQPASTGHRRS